MNVRRICWLAALVALAIGLTVVVAGCGSGTSSRSSRPASGESASGLKPIVVGDLTVRVPSEWRSYDYDLGAGWQGVSLADPRHEPSDAVIFGLYSQDEPGMTAAEMGRELADSLRVDETSTVSQRPVTLPSGITTREVRYRFDQSGRTFSGLAYAVVAPSSSGTKAYVVMYRAIESQASHMTQFRASARSIRLATPEPVKPTQRASASKRIVAGDLAMRVPAEWRSVELPSDMDGVAMSDASGATMFVCAYLDLGFQATAAESGKEMADALRADKDYSVTTEHLVTLPSGIPAYEVRYSRQEDGETLTGLEYILARGTTVYMISFEQRGSRAGKIAQFRASARSIEPA